MAIDIRKKGDKIQRKSPGSLVVKWQIEHPPTPPTKDHLWSDRPPIQGDMEKGKASQGDAATEANLGWPRGTLAALHMAFMSQLDRKTGWTEQGETGEKGETMPPHGALSSLGTAAQVFKRGVGYRRNLERPFHSQSSQGQYAIEILDPSSPPMTFQNSFVLIDQKVASLWRFDSLENSDRKIHVDFQTCSILALDVDEPKKSLETTGKILKFWKKIKEKDLSEGNPLPKPHWVIIGGGILSDIGVFAAGLVGAEVTLVPTTLLAMVDACIGGKSGVNFEPYGKNQVGLFYFPRSVIVWLGWLTTLPDREWLAGAMESLKHVIIGRESSSQLLDTVNQSLQSKNLTELALLMPQLIKVKAEIVAIDPGEQGVRAVLNFGHTLGHALETRSHRIHHQNSAKNDHDFLLHGEAVGYGMLYALLLSREVAGMSPIECDRLWRVIRFAQENHSKPPLENLNKALGVNTLDDPGLWPELRKLMSGDKKNEGNGVHWILLEKQGVPFQPKPTQWTTPVADHTLEKVWEMFKAQLQLPTDNSP